MLRKSALAVLLTGLFTAPVQAEEVYVLLMGDGYFPEYVYPDIGDTIRFVNETSVAMSATAGDGSWDTGALQPGEFAVIPVEAGMFTEYGDSVTEGNEASGVIDYVNEPPLDLEANSEPNHVATSLN